MTGHGPLRWQWSPTKRVSGDRGTTLIEVLVAFTLLATMTSVALPTLVRYARLRQTLRHERIALDELSNQLNKLTAHPRALPSTKVSAESDEGTVSELPPSDLASSVLKDIRLTVEAEPTEQATRLTLRMTWDAVGRRRRPLQLSGWVFDTESNRQRESAGEFDATLVPQANRATTLRDSDDVSPGDDPTDSRSREDSVEERPE